MLVEAVLGDKGQYDLYPASDPLMRWYRYLFLGRGKPSTHMRVLSLIPKQDLEKKMPTELKTLLDVIAAAIPPPGAVAKS